MAEGEPKGRSRSGSPASVGLVTLDRAWRMVQANVAAADILGTSVGVLVGRNVWEQFPGLREHDLGRVVESVMSTGQAASYEGRHPSSEMWLELRVQPADAGVDCYLIDVTARAIAAAHEAAATDHARLLAEVSETLGESLDVAVNMDRLAQVVIPALGSWSIVALADDDGHLVEQRSWHVDPARRDEVRRDAETRLASQSGPLLGPQTGAVLPLVARGRTVGVLWVHSDVPWTDHQVAVAEGVVARAALALDNSRAYARARAASADADAARAEAEASGQRLALLVEVSEALAGAGNADEAMARLARLVVPRLADWSLVTIVDEERGLRDVAVAHRDPARTDDVAAYAARRAQMITPDTPLAVALSTGEPYVVAEADESDIRTQQPDPGMARLRQSLDPHGVAVIPLVAGGRAFGALTLVTTRARGGHTADELSAALEVAQRTGPVLANAQTAQRSRKLAESVQRSLLTIRPARPGLEICARYRPAQVDNEVGGDWYDHFEVPTGETVLTIGDVMGHDTGAIAAMAQLRTFMRAGAWARRRSPAAVLSITDSVSRTLGPATFATAITGELDPPDSAGAIEFRWSSAGHLPPALITPDGTVSYLRAPTVDLPLGVIADAVRHDHTATLAPGSTLILFTDGLVEQRDRDLDDRLEQLRRVLSDARGPRLDDLLDAILSGMGGDAAHPDDIAILAARTAVPELSAGRRELKSRPVVPISTL